MSINERLEHLESMNIYISKRLDILSVKVFNLEKEQKHDQDQASRSTQSDNVQREESVDKS